MKRINVNFEPFLNDPDDPYEKVITFHNNLAEDELPANYRGGVICLRLRPDGGFDVELCFLSEGVTIIVSKNARVLRPPVEAYWVQSVRGAWLVLAERVMAYSPSRQLIPSLTFFASDIAKVFSSSLLWQPTVKGQAERLERLAARCGVSEQKILQRLVQRGRLLKRRKR